MQYLEVACPCCAAEDGQPGASQPELPGDAGAETIARLDKVRNAAGAQSVADIRRNLQKTMQADAAVFRTQARALSCVAPMHSCPGVRAMIPETSCGCHACMQARQPQRRVFHRSCWCRMPSKAAAC
jgi:hypothetical protein